METAPGVDAVFLARASIGRAGKGRQRYYDTRRAVLARFVGLNGLAPAPVRSRGLFSAFVALPWAEAPPVRLVRADGQPVQIIQPYPTKPDQIAAFWRHVKRYRLRVESPPDLLASFRAPGDAFCVAIMGAGDAHPPLKWLPDQSGNYYTTKGRLSREFTAAALDAFEHGRGRLLKAA